MTHVQPQTPSRSAVTWRSAGLFALRYGIGAVMVLAGIVMLGIDGGELGWYGLASAIGAGLSVILLNLLYRMSVSGDQDRAREEEARTYFDEHGEWPDDPPAPVYRRHWTLPRGVVTLEQEERERRHAAANGLANPSRTEAASAGRSRQSFPCSGRGHVLGSHAGFVLRERETSKAGYPRTR